MFDLPFCSGEYGTQVSGSSLACNKITTTTTTAGPSAPSQNMVKCIYLTKIGGTPYHITLTWSKSVGGLGLSLYACEPHLKWPNNSMQSTMRPWILGKKKGKIILPFGPSCEVVAFWDFSSANYKGSSPEPVDGFFFALVYDHEIMLLLGNMPLEAYSKTQATSCSSETNMISRREHIFGRKVYSTKAQFGENGRSHDILIECNVRAREPRLSVTVDKQVVVHVKRLTWKFRGNQTFLVDGLSVELFWDVHNWLFSHNDGHAIFMFQCSTTPTNKSWSSSSTTTVTNTSYNPLSQWHHVSGGSSLSNHEAENWGFSLLLYAWKVE